MRKGFLPMLIFVALAQADIWVQAQKSDFATGTFSGAMATWRGSEDDGLLTLRTPVYNGFFDELDSGLSGWQVDTLGGGLGVVAVGSGGGRTSVLHLKASYANGDSLTLRVYQDLTEGLESLRRFHMEIYPISSEFSGGGQVVFRVFAYDANGTVILDGGIPLRYLLKGPSLGFGAYNWRDQTQDDAWNNYTWNLKDHIETNLEFGYSWNDVARVRIEVQVRSGDFTGYMAGIYVDAIYAAPFVDDNFDDGTINTDRWTVYDTLYQIQETDGYVRFFGYGQTNDPTKDYASFDRDGDLIPAGHSAEASAMVRHAYFAAAGSPQTFSFGFYQASPERYLILRAKRSIGRYQVDYFDGTTWNTTEIAPYYLLSFSRFYHWRILYDASESAFYAWVDGKMVGKVTGFSLTAPYFPFFLATETPPSTSDSIEAHVDDFMYFDLDASDWTTRYVSSGTYISEAHDLGAYPDFGSLRWVATIPTGAQVRFQIRTAETESALQNAAWRGPNGVGDYYTVSGAAIPDYHDGDRWIQIRLEMSSTDSLSTPAVDSIIVHYTPMASVVADSGVATVTPIDTAFIHFDGSGNRAVMIYFTGVSGDFDVSAAVHAEHHPALNGGIRRWWNLSADSTSFTSAALTFVYQDGDIPQGVNEEELLGWRKKPAPGWRIYVPDLQDRDLDRNRLTLRGLTGFSQWTLAPSGATHVAEAGSDSAETPLPHAIFRGRELILSLPRSMALGLRLYDLRGRCLWRVPEKMWPAGAHRLRPPFRLPQGVYVLWIEQGQESASPRKILILRD